MKLKYFTRSDGSGNGGLDTAFQEVARQVLTEVPPELRQHPSAAPSPILQSLLRLEWDQKGAHIMKTEVPTTNPGKVAPGVSAAQGVDHQRGGEIPSGSNSSLLGRQLLKRGVAPKDPLIKRLAAYKSKVCANANLNDGNSSVLSETNAVSHSGFSSAPSGSGVAEHWTRRRLSEMTPSSWAIFREQLGIDITPVNVRDPSKREEDSSQGVSSPATRVVYTVDTVSPIRCWHEAQLPFALGCCVGAFYAFPTAIQSQCIPLAMTELPSAIPSERRADHCTSPNLEILNKIDIIGVAETGSGKTLSYLIPALADICTRRPKLLGNHERITLGPMALIMVPTRELAEQVMREALALLNPDTSKMHFPIKVAGSGKSSSLGHPSTGRRLIEEWEEYELSDLPNDASRAAYRREHNMLSEIRVVKVVGGEKVEEQFEKLSRGAHMVVGTIGQLAALLEDRFLSLGNTQLVVVDEADRMIDERQGDILFSVLERCPRPRQTLLFTATMSRACEEIARKYLSPKGFFVVRTLHRCASIRQSFELIPLMDNSLREVNTGKKAFLRGFTSKNQKNPANEAAQRRLDPLIYPLKFNRLVTWLVYATGPIIIFAGEKRVCDALQDELRREAGHLAQILDERGLPPAGRGLMDVPSVDAPPQGLVFQEDTGLSLYAAQQRRVAAEKTLASTFSSSLKLENLTSTAVVHSELSQNERRRLTELFHRQQRKVLITTDLLSRGLDVPGVALVINYDLPWPSEKASPGSKGNPHRGFKETPDEAFVRYIHRIGRTGRAGATGIALSFVSLPLARIQKASSAVVVTASSNASSLHLQEPSEGRKGDELSRRIYPPGTTDAVKQRDRDQFELTHHHDDNYGDTTFGNGEVDGALNDADNDDDSDRGSSVASNDSGRPRKHLRGEEGTSTILEGTERRESITPYSDESLLKPLWKFLLHCIEGNGYSRDEAVRALRQETYSKIDLPPALAFIMYELAMKKGKYGTITQ